MNKFREYFKLECKRFLPLYAFLGFITVLVLISAYFFLRSQLDKKNSSLNTEISIGFVADEMDFHFFDMGFFLLQNGDHLGRICNFKKVTSEEGQQLLESHQIDILLLFPKNYVQSVYYGYEEPIIVRFGTAQSGISSLLFHELSLTISNYMMEQKAGIYTMQSLYKSWNLNPGPDSDELAELYIRQILNRSLMLKEEFADPYEGLNTLVYYFCVAIVFLLMFWEMVCGIVVGNQNHSLSTLLTRNGLSFQLQYLARFLALSIFIAINYLLLAIPLTYMMQRLGFLVISLMEHLGMCFIILFSSALTLFIFECTKDSTQGMLFIFFSSILMGFLSGFFYPLSFFPLWIQKAAHFLPTKVMLDYVTQCYTGNISLKHFGVPVLYLLIICCITLLLCKYKYRNFVRDIYE